MTSLVMTVRGEVPATELGTTLPHEHVFINLVREYRGTGLLNDPVLAVSELERFRGAGGNALVDCTNIGLQRDPMALRRVSEETGLHIVMGCGLYRDPYIDTPWLDRTSTDELAALIVRDIKEGADGTDVRSGIIGEIGADKWYISAAEERSFRAAARAHKETGLTITTHAARWPVGGPQLDILEEEGVDPRRVIVGHCDMVPIPEYHVALAKRGAYVEFDTIRGESEYDTETRVGFVLAMAREGYLEHVLLSHDVCLRSQLHAMGGCGYDFVLTDFLPRLGTAGLSDDDIRVLTVENPRRALTGAD
jgi:predicted metal-dependent phosphotriesterase family hydrolase